MKIEDAFFESASGKLNQLPESTVPEIVFSGRSNVGKSSLINKLLNRKSLARVSATPGKTGTVNFYRLSSCRLADLPGYGYAKVSQSEKMRWAELVEGYLSSGRNIRLVIQIVDLRHNPTADDLHMVEFLLQSGCPFLIAATKSDKLNKTQRTAQLQTFHDRFDPLGVPVVPFSAVTAEGVEEIRGRIDRACE
ncbi:MAG: YihA family ribosome biogenesis GTP-binding protein [Clostridiales bacterium]|nr:YihA family ribosome biogenesis GTP-binding protein [Clostridiales bacterium]